MSLLEADLIDQLGSDETDRERVKKSMLALLAHARLLRSQPASFAQQMAQAALGRLRGVLSFAFEKDALDDEALVMLQREIERVAQIDVLSRAVVVQRAMMFEVGKNPAVLNRMGVSGPFQMFQSFDAAIGSRDKRLLEMSQQYEEAIQYAALPASERLRAGATQRQLVNSAGFLGIFAFAADYPQIFWSDAQFIANLEVIRAGLAAERYARKHGTAPKDLKVLVPEFLSAVPEDPFDGQPLHSCFADRLVIYSVGIDGNDNTAQNPLGSKNQTDLRIRVK